ncbi:MAG: hypothetical protein JW828_03935 [Sedimentisphaerales bacterium]|nr:hypothetical protein [Sedimentisphaerales bacterium]
MMRKSNRIACVCLMFFCVCSVGRSVLRPAGPRQVISLDGPWQIAEGTLETMPESFKHTVPVPGLVDMAEPAFVDVGKKNQRRQAFWYRRTFTVGCVIPEVALLKFHKARYGTKVWLNGKPVGEHLPCFTPAYMNIKEHLKGNGAENILIVRVGAYRDMLPDGYPTGWDFEKYKYIPGIYDSVELILTGGPYVETMQTAPDIAAGSVRVRTELLPLASTDSCTVQYEVHEARSQKLVGAVKSDGISLQAGRKKELDTVIPIGNVHLWSPEDPFLYELKIKTGGDAVKVRFGMRQFHFDPKTKQAMLNGKPYFMRGTNVCIYRFFEDDLRSDRPWREEWVRRLHEKFKSMHWNSIRYCIGFPPEIWYDIADEAGFLIQDEFPVWLLSSAPEKPRAEILIPQYIDWMKKRWNHPCVVIWDAQNESVTPETAKVINAVRGLDLSDRPWENGWETPQRDTDPRESHPYLFIKTWQGNEPFRLENMTHVSGRPGVQSNQKRDDVPILINEYAWLWLNRDGTPTTLTKEIYKNFFGPWSSTNQRRERYARYLAALTEFWRCHRECAGVLHFCGLGYSRSGLLERPEGGATSDHFVDLEKLVFEPYFEEYVKESFHPVGVMLNFWAQEVPAGISKTFEIYVINDLYEDWSGLLRLHIMKENQMISIRTTPLKVASLGREIVQMTETLPAEPGEYTIIAEIQDETGRQVRSLRDVKMTENP